MSQWVQHISGKGEKWKVIDFESLSEWKVEAKVKTIDHCHFIPKSEYRLCDQPEVWQDVTGECTINCAAVDIIYNGKIIFCRDGVRLRKVQMTEGWDAEKHWAFIVEKKVQS
jgi:hypothetical protein